MGWFDERFAPMDGRLQFDCIACNRPMWFPKSKHGKYVTCGPECASKHRALKLQARTRICETCGSEFTPRARQIAMGNGRFCSQRCNTASHEAMNTQEAQAKAKAAWKATHERSPIVKPGPSNPGWTGGRSATYRRVKESGKKRIYYANRKRRNGTTRASPELVQRLGQRQRWKCAACATHLNKYEVDHIIPLAKGGTNEDGNFQLLCITCNRSKGAKHPIDFMQSRGFLL